MARKRTLTKDKLISVLNRIHSENKKLIEYRELRSFHQKQFKELSKKCRLQERHLTVLISQSGDINKGKKSG